MSHSEGSLTTRAQEIRRHGLERREQPQTLFPRFVAALMALGMTFSGLAVGAGEECRSAISQLNALYEIRSMMVRQMPTGSIEAFIDQKVDALRQPLPNGGYRWVRWVRRDSDAPTEKKGHKVAAVKGDGTDSFEASGEHVFSVRLEVPQKRSLFKSNNPVYVGTVSIHYTADGRSLSAERAINQWMNPDTSKTIDLETIADRVDVTVDAATNKENLREALVEVHFRKAVAEDNPASPGYATVRALSRARASLTPATIDEEVAAMERGMFPAADPLPILTVVTEIRQAGELMRSKKPEDQEKGERMMREAVRKLGL